MGWLLILLGLVALPLAYVCWAMVMGIRDVRLAERLGLPEWPDCAPEEWSIAEWPCCGGGVRLRHPSGVAGFTKDNCPTCNSRVWFVHERAGQARGLLQPEFERRFSVDQDSRAVRLRPAGSP